MSEKSAEAAAIKSAASGYERGGMLFAAWRCEGSARCVSPGGFVIMTMASGPGKCFRAEWKFGSSLFMMPAEGKTMHGVMQERSGKFRPGI